MFGTGLRWRCGPIVAWVAVLTYALGRMSSVASAADPLFGELGVAHVRGGVQAPDFELPTSDQNDTVALKRLRGKVVFINFWATWCPPCREEMPSMERLHKEFKDQGLAVLAVNIQESSKQVARFMKNFQLSFPALLDSDLKVTGLYQVRGLPSTYLIDQKGQVVGQAIGPRDWASPQAKALIRSLLDPAAARR